MSDSLSWDDQRAFLAILEGGSLSAAARALGVAQPTVRARLEALEQGLGVVLFTRSSQGLLPTEQARALHEHARAMDHASRSFVRMASAPHGEVAGSVRLSVSEFIGIEVLPAFLAELRIEYPKLVVELDLSDVAANISEQEADIAVRNVAPSQDTLVARKVGEVSLGLFAHRDYIAARGCPQTLDDLAFHDIIGPDRSALDQRLASAVFPAAVVRRMLLRTDSHPAQLAAARAGLGITVVQRPLALSDARLVPVLPDFVVATLPIWLVTHRNLKSEPRVRATLDTLARAFTNYCRGESDNPLRLTPEERP